MVSTSRGGLRWRGSVNLFGNSWLHKREGSNDAGHVLRAFFSDAFSPRLDLPGLAWICGILDRINEAVCDLPRDGRGHNEGSGSRDSPGSFLERLAH